MPSYEDMQSPTPENLWVIITAVAADLIFAMEMHPVPPLTDDEEDAWRKVVKRIRDDYPEDPICVQPPPPPAAEDIEPPPPAAEDILPPAAEDNQPPAAEDRPPTPGPAEGSPPEAPPAEPTPAPRRTLRARFARAWRRVRRFFTCSATRTA
ncbi:nuclear pore complex-interacting protein family member B12-like [Hyperolius riggenbachi]|uniref:nuclear pore complex-interacting protein family member B12-like n=1 Tax=Hyperolius riggenbachi TaxID=752182 RepID=UPI0035A2E8A6